MRYFIGFLVTIGLLIFLIVLLVRGGGDNNKVPQTKKPLVSYASTDAVVKLTLDGPINSQQEHQQTQITVGQDEVVMEEFTGYEGNSTFRQSFKNNQSAYSNFLYALKNVGFTNGDTSKNLANESGRCPLGNRYVFEVIQDGQNIQHFWATSCGKTKTYLGNVGQTINLFQKQVPNYKKLPHVQASTVSL